ncbi:metalloregulator ArsR/SmtB family transcription factor [Fictibacillus sp. KIGAM418]|uniref:Metalloregulator ArsR/SmtB family transcription factor n=1 Tax=Fictibacillus marinisediminis TaxID=2878389 RepID=A0A9X2BG08_9BACL|nr:metalloregulator ArsR/SmtB family transcription factor [Fictibacillus marinisediminis]MCK6257832.1 metalloregulator ArsR/SmtB family transcription factor [Fictibacillus marinisediminis]
MIEKAIHSLSVPTRRAILDVLRGRELASSDIAAHFELSAPAISQHLKVLHDSGMVVVRKSGTKRYYRIRREGFADLKEFVDQFWDNSLFALKEAAEEEERRKHE